MKEQEHFRRHFGMVLRQTRNNEGITQQQLEAATGVQRGYISDLECGRKGISLFELFKICKGFPNNTASDLVAVLATWVDTPC